MAGKDWQWMREAGQEQKEKVSWIERKQRIGSGTML